VRVRYVIPIVLQAGLVASAVLWWPSAGCHPLVVDSCGSLDVLVLVSMASDPRTHLGAVGHATLFAYGLPARRVHNARLIPQTISTSSSGPRSTTPRARLSRPSVSSRGTELRDDRGPSPDRADGGPPVQIHVMSTISGVEWDDAWSDRVEGLLAITEFSSWAAKGSSATSGHRSAQGPRRYRRPRTGSRAMTRESPCIRTALVKSRRRVMPRP
jgi:hypothetical protein